MRHIRLMRRDDSSGGAHWNMWFLQGGFLSLTLTLSLTLSHKWEREHAPLMELLAIRLSTIKPCKSLVIPLAGEGSSQLCWSMKF